MRVSGRGQITIPKKLRERLGLVHNVEVDITPTQNGVIIRRKDTERPVGEVADRHWSEPFDLEKFLNDPNPKIFDPDKVVTASEPFDVDEFLRFVHHMRDDEGA